MALSQQQFESICKKLESSNMGIRTIITKHYKGIGVETFYRHMRRDQQNRERYARAKTDQAESILDQIHDLEEQCKKELETIEDTRKCNALVQYYKLKVDNLKWLLSKLLPSKYGDKLDVTSGGDKLPVPPASLTITIAKDGKK